MSSINGIKAAAKEACEQIKKLYPLEQWDTDTRTCIADAQKLTHQAKGGLHEHSPIARPSHRQARG
jgi:hypothetical protein